MGMPIEIEVVGEWVEEAIEEAFAYLASVDERFSTYKDSSEISRINRGELTQGEASEQMRAVIRLAERTKKETDGFFDIQRSDGLVDPSGIVKGWAICNTAELIQDKGHENFFVNAGGDVATGGKNADGLDWTVGIRSPFKEGEIVKILYPRGKGVATSGSYERGAHIYNPHDPTQALDEIVSLTVIGPDVLEADRFATGAFAMGKKGINFIESLPGFEGYAIDKDGIATMTSGFEVYTR
jgi:FAD:protein FMN transferase